MSSLLYILSIRVFSVGNTNWFYETNNYKMLHSLALSVKDAKQTHGSEILVRRMTTFRTVWLVEQRRRSLTALVRPECFFSYDLWQCRCLNWWVNETEGGTSERRTVSCVCGGKFWREVIGWTVGTPNVIIVRNTSGTGSGHKAWRTAVGRKLAWYPGFRSMACLKLSRTGNWCRLVLNFSLAPSWATVLKPNLRWRREIRK